MSSPLHKSPKGLLELFKLQTLGRAPVAFGGECVPIVNAAEFYGAANKIAQANVAAVGGMTLLSTLAATALLRYHSVGVVGNVGAAAGTNFTISVELVTPTAQTIPLGGIFYAALAAGQSWAFGVSLPNPLVLLPGWSIRGRWGGTAAGVDHSLQVVSLVDDLTLNAP